MLYRSRQHPSGKRRAAAVVELVVLLPVVVFLFAIAIDFARVFYYLLTVDNCARNGAVFASLAAESSEWQGNGGLIQATQQAAIADGGSLNPPLATSNVTVQNGTDANGNAVVEVTVTYPFAPIVRFPGIGTTLSLTRTVQMRTAP